MSSEDDNFGIDHDLPDVDIPGRWDDLQRILQRTSPLAGAGFVPDTVDKKTTFNFLREESDVLCVGAGGLGCDILKCLALSGFRHIHVIDMDTIDATNLNRQFLFRASDVGSSKAQAATAFVNKRVAGADVQYFHGMMQDKDEDWYTNFAMVVCGLDSVKARRWINAVLFNLLVPVSDEEDDGDDDGPVEYDLDTVIPFVDAGTEGWKGHVRVVFPGTTSCLECTIEMFPPQIKVPMCTLAATPRSAAHCIQWASFLAWDEEKPFTDAKGAPLKPDSDNPKHMQWLYEKAAARAKEFNLTGVTYKETLGVFKNIIPAIASTNALTAAVACNEAMKLGTEACAYLNNYMMYNGEQGVYSGTQSLGKNPECTVCGKPNHKYDVDDTKTDEPKTLGDLLQELAQVPKFQFTKPGVSTLEGTPLYLIAPTMLEKRLRPNLDAKLSDVLAEHGNTLSFTDPTLPAANVEITFNLKTAV